jgi:hypothetical protein
VRAGGAIDGLGAGTYRMRVSARGRDAGSNGEQAEEPVDFYLAQLWLAPEEPDAVLRVGSGAATRPTGTNWLGAGEREPEERQI